MNLGAAGLDLIKSYEQLRLVAYHGADDPPGLYTIGYGHIDGVQAGDTCTVAQALEWLQEDTQAAQDAVNRLVDVDLTQNQFDALVSFTFNEGGGNLSHSTLLQMLNAGEIAAAAAQFMRWDVANGQISGGLERRRAAERLLFLS